MSDRDRRRERDRDNRDRSKDRHHRSHRSRSRSPDRKRSRSRTYSPDRHRDRHHRDHDHDRDRDRDRDRTRDRRRSRRSSTPADSPPRKRHKDAVADFVEGIAKDQKDKSKDANKKEEVIGDADMMDADEMEMMKQLGIPVGFDSTKGKHVDGNDVGGVRKVTKRQPRQYMNRRGGFNRPLPAEVNR